MTLAYSAATTLNAPSSFCGCGMVLCGAVAAWRGQWGSAARVAAALGCKLPANSAAPGFNLGKNGGVRSHSKRRLGGSAARSQFVRARLLPPPPMSCQHRRGRSCAFPPGRLSLRAVVALCQSATCGGASWRALAANGVSCRCAPSRRSYTRAPLARAACVSLARKGWSRCKPM
jgi:hypothetical protein